jgi:glycosyltransferase involved in cell wall biosynthesis
MKILFVCQQYIHSARWIQQLKDSHHEIFVFDCLDRPIHEDLEWTKYTQDWSKRKIPYVKGEHFLKKKFPKIYEWLEPRLKVTASEKLAEIIREIQPDLVHSLEMQSQTYHVEKVRRKLKFAWAYSSWGSDLYLYQNKKNHRSKIIKSLSKINYFFSDNTRDIKIAKQLGFKGINMPVFPGGGGYDLSKYEKYRDPLKDRNTIIIKGYHHWVGRALFILKALETIIEHVRDMEIYVYSAHQVVIDQIKKMNQEYNINMKYSSRKEELSHEELLQKFGQSKIAIASSISDGIPNTLLESMILGAFPIQSNPGGVTEDHIEDGVNGLLIQNPEDAEEIAQKIREALSNQNRLENAYAMNLQKAETLAYSVIQKQVLESYQEIENQL